MIKDTAVFIVKYQLPSIQERFQGPEYDGLVGR